MPDGFFSPRRRSRSKAHKPRRYQHGTADKRVVLDKFRKNGCRVCGELQLCCLESHHLDPREKDFTISQAKRHDGISLAAFEAELLKCVCLCKNCHAKVHAGVLVLSDILPDIRPVRGEGLEPTTSCV